MSFDAIMEEKLLQMPLSLNKPEDVVFMFVMKYCKETA